MRGVVRRLLDWERDAIVDAYKAGEKRDAISAEFGVCGHYPRMLAARRGIAGRSAGRPPGKRSQAIKPVLVTT